VAEGRRAAEPISGERLAVRVGPARCSVKQTGLARTEDASNRDLTPTGAPAAKAVIDSGRQRFDAAVFP
jgi:hypothetical protein